MPDLANLLVVTVVALLAPLLLGMAPRVRVPSVVLEIVAGVVLGPSVLGLVEVDEAVRIVALLGLAFLLFLSGLEVDVHRLRGSLLRTALLGYALTMVIGVLAGFSFGAAGWVRDPLLIAVALSATSLGLVVPVLKDAGRADDAAGQTTIAASSVADFGAVVLVSLLFSVSETTPGERIAFLAVFVVFVAAIGVAVALAGRWSRLDMVFLRLQDTTAELRVRAAVALLVAFVVLAELFGLESILGAFLAGAVVGLIDRDTSTHPHFRTKLDAIGYGFLIPVFFISSGVTLDLRGLVEEPTALLRVPLFLLALLLVRGVPALLYVRALGSRSAVAAGFLQATSLPFLVTTTQIGESVGLIAPVTGAALVCAGLLSVLLFPSAALALLRRDRRPRAGSRTG
ncbi:transporter (CPA2 family) [Saccharopolyspora erythraea NRRL 2338]|uniref:Na+/H+ antiporter homolog n=2 Tax=Saccharopolyspora erythraea TaxID=1836 RepID=A4FKJ1_SACEN|nr:cation:proton antiporter [Saccharopolyspora erythraea]PFG98204.1 transporter (CPA2 family) [Saccharopolyspora erythraea NRRL 2338]QRK88304.1 cation:proton antiporter [Saccharopolyspora erythraea]CAM04566.1 Na+/H+ antiporter homolog [Saccharopolyspora erythraea NRRL 2338]